jgi:hypothetical protein
VPYKEKSVAKMSSWPSRGKGSRNERAKDVGKGPPIYYDGPLGLDHFEEATYEFQYKVKVI